jgi:hypothetical protein
MLGFMVRQCSEFDNLRALVLLYNALGRSNLEHNTIIWCPLYQNAIHRIEKIQRKFIKFACYKCHIHFDRNNYDNILAYFGLSTLTGKKNGTLISQQQIIPIIPILMYFDQEAMIANITLSISIGYFISNFA